MRINLIAPINKLGYGVVGTNLLKVLNQTEEQVGLVPIGQPEYEPELDSLIKASIETGKTIELNAKNIRLWHQFDMRMFPPGERIGFPIFELDKFTALEHNNLSSLDRLFVCSSWAKEIVLQNGISVPIDVIPLGYNPSTFNASDSEVDPHKFVFMNIGKWEIRKGHDILPEIFNRAFGPNFKTPDGRAIVLRMMCTNPFLTAEETARWEGLYKRTLKNNVEFVQRVSTAADVALWMKRANAGIFPARAEGWNLELLEMQACGKPCLATNYSAHVDFCDENGLVPYHSLVKAYDGKWFFGQGQWAEFDHYDDWIDRLRDLVENYENYTPKKAVNFTWKNTKDVIMTHLKFFNGDVQ